MVFKSSDPCLFTINVFICDNYEATEILHLESIFLLQTHLISVAVGPKVALIPKEIQTTSVLYIPDITKEHYGQYGSTALRNLKKMCTLPK